MLKRLALPAIDALIWDALSNDGGGEPCTAAAARPRATSAS